MALPTVVQLDQFQSSAYMELELRASGTYRQVSEIKGNSILSSVFVESIDPGATVQVNYFDTTLGASVGERYDLDSHTLIDDTSAGETFRLLVGRIHRRVVCEVIVTGGSAKFSVYATVVGDFPLDFGQAKLDAQSANLSEDKGVVVAGYDDADGKFYLIPIEDGAVKTKTVVSADVPSTSGSVTELTIDNTSWTPVPLNVLRRAIAVINESGQEIKLNYAQPPTYVGIPIKDGSERRYEHRVLFYLRSESSACTVLIENIL